MSKAKNDPEDFDEEDLIRSEFDSIVAGLSLDESAPTTYLDELDAIDTESFAQPNPPIQSVLGFFQSAKLAIKKWLRRGYHEDDGATL